MRAAVDIPLAVKVGPFFSSPGNMARRLEAAGADGLVLFNRFYQPDIDLDAWPWCPTWCCAPRPSMRLVLRWMAILKATWASTWPPPPASTTPTGAVKSCWPGPTW